MDRRYLRSADLRDYITIQALDGTVDSMGAPAENWTDVVTVWSDIRMMREQEVFVAHQLGAEVTHRVRVRFEPLITSKMRVQFVSDRGTRLFKISSIDDEDARSGFMFLVCGEYSEGTR